jgi:hypothetical protein
MKECATDYEVLPRSSPEHQQSSDKIENRKKWEELVILLIKESKSNNVSLRLTFHLLQMLMTQDPDLYRNLIVLLPEIALMLNELELCHSLISHSCFEKRLFGCSMTMMKVSSSPAEFHKPLYSLLHDSDPICRDKILIFNLLMVKLAFVQRIRSMRQLQRQWNGLPQSVFEFVGDFLGLPKVWGKIRIPILERQCMDMVKMLNQVDVHFVPFIVRSCQSSRLQILLRAWPSSQCTETLRYWLFICRLCSNQFVLDFLQEVSADMRLN